MVKSEKENDRLERRGEKPAPDASTAREKKLSKEKAGQARQAEVQPAAEQTAVKIRRSIPAPPRPAPVKKNEDLIKVEKILEEDLEEAYAKLPPEKRAAFKKEGERVAIIIWQMVEAAKFHARKIINLIKGWLKIIPGINRFFLEQEIKIKTDKIMELAKQHNKDQR